MSISSVWTDLSNPELDPAQVAGGENGLAEHPSTRMKQLGSADGRSEEGWATVRIDGRDWGKVMSVGRLGGRVIACEYPTSRQLTLVYGFQLTVNRLLPRARPHSLCLPAQR
jgi:hypothetical protein